MKDYAANNLRRLKITVFTDNSIRKINGRTVYLSDGKVFDDTLVVWAAGVKTSAFILGLTVEKNPQGRIKVDDYLRLDGGCFVAGDASYFSHRGNFLRMAV
jgi:NADH dehydrogenase FAD-containing subunit